MANLGRNMCGFKNFKDFKVTSVENTEKCSKTLTSRTKDREEK
jgi:hypothetical protein